MHLPLRELQHAPRSSGHVGARWAVATHDWPRRTRGREHGVDAPPIGGVEPVVELVQQQPVRILHQGARQQREALLPVRQGQKFAARVAQQAAGPQSRRPPAWLRPS